MWSPAFVALVGHHDAASARSQVEQHVFAVSDVDRSRNDRLGRAQGCDFRGPLARAPMRVAAHVSARQIACVVTDSDLNTIAEVWVVGGGGFCLVFVLLSLVVVSDVCAAVQSRHSSARECARCNGPLVHGRWPRPALPGADQRRRRAHTGRRASWRRCSVATRHWQRPSKLCWPCSARTRRAVSVHWPVRFYGVRACAALNTDAAGVRRQHSAR